MHSLGSLSPRATGTRTMPMRLHHAALRPLALSTALVLSLWSATSVANPAISRFTAPKAAQAHGSKVAPGAPIYFTSGATAGNQGGDTVKGQSLVTMKSLAENLAKAGLGLSDVVHVRTYLVPGPDGTVDYAGWDAAWAEVFGTSSTPIKPPLSLVAVPQLGRPTTLVEIEYVAVAGGGDKAFENSTPFAADGNPVLKPYGSQESRIAAGVGIAAGAGYYWTAGTLAGLAKPEAPQNSRERHGDMKFQAISTLQRLKDNLATVGLTFKDVVFMRAFVAPDKLDGNKFDTAGWNEGYSEFFNRPDNPHKPARATVTTPTYGGPGPLLEVELVTAFPGALPATVVFDDSKPETVNAHLKAFGAPQSPISSGMAVKPGSSLYFSAGALPSVGGDMKTQALSALENLKTQMAEAGVGFKDVVFLRAYVVPEASGMFDRQGWSEAYGAHFGTPSQTHKPARTTIAVHSLSKPDVKIAIDVIAVAAPKAP